jgi:tRNA threonylcarbamoyladenosine biosynthesis protein TsaB
MLLLGIDTCGPLGSVALGQLAGDAVRILDQTELAGRTYSATLVPAIEGLLKAGGATLGDIGCIVVVHGPGSFTGVRVGLSAAKGLAEGAGIALAAVSRLRVLAGKARVEGAALDAHRHELFLRIGESEPQELLAGADELARLAPASEIAVCDDPAEALLGEVWPSAPRVRVAPPTAADALVIAAPAVVAGQFADPVLLDGNYLRRSDAEIFGSTVGKS